MRFQRSQRCKASYADAAKSRCLVAASHLSFPGIGPLRAEGKGCVRVPLDSNTIR